MAVTVDKNLCPQNHPCPAIKVCPVNALSQVDNKLPVVDADLCIECGVCVDFCPMGALKVEE